MSKKNKFNHVFLYNFVFFAGLNILTNFICKYVAEKNLLLENSFLRLTYIHNSGAAFNILDSQIPFLVAVGALALVYIVHKIYFSSAKANKISSLGFAMLAAGIVHNMYERIYFGYVVDYFDLKFINFPVFNMADVLITCGAAILIWQILVKKL